jgi:hypothetical protein
VFARVHQALIVVQGSNRSLFWNPSKTHKFPLVGRTYSFCVLILGHKAIKDTWYIVLYSMYRMVSVT